MPILYIFFKSSYSFIPIPEFQNSLIIANLIDQFRLIRLTIPFIPWLLKNIFQDTFTSSAVETTKTYNESIMQPIRVHSLR